MLLLPDKKPPGDLVCLASGDPDLASDPEKVGIPLVYGPKFAHFSGNLAQVGGFAQKADELEVRRKELRKQFTNHRSENPSTPIQTPPESLLFISCGRAVKLRTK